MTETLGSGSPDPRSPSREIGIQELSVHTGSVENGGLLRTRKGPAANRPPGPFEDGEDGSEGVDPLRDRGLLVRGLVAVDDTLGDRLVQLLGGVTLQLEGLVLVTGLRGLAELADRGLHRGPDRLVALTRLLVRGDALDLRLDVGHEAFPLSLGEVRCRVCCGPAHKRVSSRSECRTATRKELISRGQKVRWRDR